MSESTTTSHEYRRDREHKQRRRHLSTAVTESVDLAHEALSTGQLGELASVIDAVILPILDLEPAEIWGLEEIADDLDLPFYPTVVRTLLQDGAAVLAREGAASLLRDGFESLETALVIDGHLQGGIETEQKVTGLETSLGLRYVRATSDLGGELSINDHDDELGSILFAGGKGAGKSTALGRLVEDRIAAGHKVIDVVDYHKGENATYDVENQDDELRDWCERIGVPGSFDGDPDYTPPDLEFLVPLTPRVEEAMIPIQETDDGDRPVVRPFTIPASELSYASLIMVLPHTTQTHENYLESAYQKLELRSDDWTLEDMAEVVRHETNSTPKVADKIERSLRTVQEKSYIRDHECPHSLDWREIMADEEVVTSFSVHMMREDLDKKTVLSYLLDKIGDVRDDLLLTNELWDYPTVSLVMREAHKIAPKKRSTQSAVSDVEGHMIDSLADIFAMARHQKLEIIADTQQYHQQLANEVSGLFDEIYAFQGHKPDVKAIFKTRVGTEASSVAEKVSQYETGMCAHVSSDGYDLPIRMAPPRFHHLDADRDGSGLGFRARVLDDERLEESPFSAELPQRLRFDLEADQTDDHDEILQRKLTYTGDSDDYVFTETITDVYLEACERREIDPLGETRSGTHNKINGRLKELYDVGDDVDCKPVHPEHGRQCPARRGFRWATRAMTDGELEELPDR